MRRNRVLAWLDRLLLPGVVVHELAHALTVALVPGVRIVEFDATSHVRHEGRYTVTRTFLISYAPLVVNTAVGAACAYALGRLAPVAGPRETLLGAVLLYLAVVTVLEAFPSFQDAITPLQLLRRQLFTRRGLVLLPLSPLIVLVSLPGIAVTYVCRRWVEVRLALAALYAGFVMAIALGILAVPTDPAVYRGLLEGLLGAVATGRP